MSGADLNLGALRQLLRIARLAHHPTALELAALVLAIATLERRRG